MEKTGKFILNFLRCTSYQVASLSTVNHVTILDSVLEFKYFRYTLTSISSCTPRRNVHHLLQHDILAAQRETVLIHMLAILTPKILEQNKCRNLCQKHMHLLRLKCFQCLFFLPFPHFGSKFKALTLLCYDIHNS